MVQPETSAHAPGGHGHDESPQEPLNEEPGFRGVDVPTEADLYRCVHCGLCLSSCPTYTTLKVETESPRGRIALMRAVHEGRVGISNRIVSHWEMCLQCRACEAVCPSGVPYGRIMEYTRAQTLAQDKQGRALKRVDRFFLRAALPHPGRLRLGAHLMRLYQRSGLRRLVRASGLLKLFPDALSQMEAQLPDLNEPFFGPGRDIHPARSGQANGEAALAAPTVALLSGCVMPLMQGDTMRAAVRVLTRNGCNVAVPPGQVCCGALNLHAGDLETARRLARRNIDIFLATGAGQPGYKIVTASAGCGSNMKEYGELLKHDPEYAEPARRFSDWMGIAQDQRLFDERQVRGRQRQQGSGFKRCAGIDAGDVRMGDRAAHEGGVHHAVENDVIGEPRPAGEQAGIFDAAPARSRSITGQFVTTFCGRADSAGASIQSFRDGRRRRGFGAQFPTSGHRRQANLTGRAGRRLTGVRRNPLGCAPRSDRTCGHEPGRARTE